MIVTSVNYVFTKILFLLQYSALETYCLFLQLYSTI